MVNKLKIGHVQINDGNVYLATNFQEEDAKFASQEISRQYFEREWNNKQLIISGNGYTIKTKIKKIQCTSNLIDFKVIHFLTELTDIGRIKINDLVEVI